MLKNGNFKANHEPKTVIIAGGGLAGLVTAICLARKGIFCTVVEKKSYPFHRVCGEYISHEVVPFLRSQDLYPSQFNPPQISRFQLSSTRGKSAVMPLDLGGFGISRFNFDNFLFQKAKETGVNFLLSTEVEAVDYIEDKFTVKLSSGTLEGDVVVGSFGKRSRIDNYLKRDFLSKRSPYVAVKYHLKTDHPSDLIALHNFQGGYCGMSQVENGVVNLCYLVHRDRLRESGSIEGLQENILFKNPLLKHIFTNAEFLFKKPETINEISFATKRPVENHILMAGDAAGMITPLCGNGMAMAIHAAKIVSDLITKFCLQKNFSREHLEKAYTKAWNQEFSRRLWIGRRVQGLFGSEAASDIAINLALFIKPIAMAIVRNTHGKPF
jgi:flavin-dependent dehydrogenase